MEGPLWWPGGKGGLTWEVASGQAPCPLGPERGPGWHSPHPRWVIRCLSALWWAGPLCPGREGLHFTCTGAVGEDPASLHLPKANSGDIPGDSVLFLPTATCHSLSLSSSLPRSREAEGEDPTNKTTTHPPARGVSASRRDLHRGLQGLSAQGLPGRGEGAVGAPCSGST